MCTPPRKLLASEDLAPNATCIRLEAEILRVSVEPVTAGPIGG